MRRALALIVAGVASCTVWTAHPRPAAADSASTMKVSDAAEAWYQTPPASTCSSPVGCPPASAPSVFPKDTLHVGEFAGSQTAATYVQPDLSGIPSGDRAVAGTMTLPLATVNGNGNANAAAATVTACIVTTRITDGVEGSTASPPKSDCNVKVAVKAGATSFTLDLAPFLVAWNAGRSEDGIALLADTSQPSAWHVAFNGRNLTGATHIMSDLTLAPAAAAGQGSFNVSGTMFGSSSGGAPQSAAPSGVFNTAPFATPGAPTPGVTPAGAPSPAIASTPAAQAPAEQPSVGTRAAPVVAVSHGFQYPEILLLPLVLLAGTAFAMRLLTSDATPIQRRTSREAA